MKKIKTFIFLSIIAVLMFSALPASVFAQNDNDSEKKLMEDVKSDKKGLILANLELSEEQKESFLPLYEEYQAELAKLNDRLVSLIQNYATIYNNKSITDAEASKLLNELLSIETRDAEMKNEFAKKLLAVLPAIKVTKYIQMENKIRAVLKYELAAQIPLVK